jgi:hypothetical protein
MRDLFILARPLSIFPNVFLLLLFPTYFAVNSFVRVTVCTLLVIFTTLGSFMRVSCSCFHLCAWRGVCV